MFFFNKSLHFLSLIKMQFQSRKCKFIIAFLIIVSIVQSTIIAILTVDKWGLNNPQYESKYHNVEPVNVCIIEKKSFTGIKYTYGQIKSSKFINFKAPYLNGYHPIITNINFEAGKYVNEGDVLMELKCPELEYKLESLKKDSEQKKIYYDKVVSLKGAASTYETNKALLDFQRSVIEVKITQESLKNLKFVAPFSGITSKSESSIGDKPDSNKLLFSLYDNEKLNVEFYIDNNDIDYLRQNGKVVLTSIDSNNSEVDYIIAEANVIGINPFIDEQTGKVKVIATIDKESLLYENNDILKHNAHVYVYYDKEPINDVFILNRSAILDCSSTNNYSYVRLVKTINGQDIISMVRVEIVDHQHDTYAVKSEQLKNGDRIVVEGCSKRDGQQVSVKKIIEI